MNKIVIKLSAGVDWTPEILYINSTVVFKGKIPSKWGSEEGRTYDSDHAGPWTQHTTDWGMLALFLVLRGSDFHLHRDKDFSALVFSNEL